MKSIQNLLFLIEKNRTVIGLDEGEIYITIELYSLPGIFIPKNAWRLGRSGACPPFYYQELHGGLGCLPYLWTSLAYHGYQARDRYRIRPGELHTTGRVTQHTCPSCNHFAREHNPRFGLAVGINASRVKTTSK